MTCEEKLEILKTNSKNLEIIFSNFVDNVEDVSRHETTKAMLDNLVSYVEQTVELAKEIIT